MTTSIKLTALSSIALLMASCGSKSKRNDRHYSTPDTVVEQTGICDAANLFAKNIATIDLADLEFFNFVKQVWDRGMVRAWSLTCDAKAKRVVYETRRVTTNPAGEPDKVSKNIDTYNWEGGAWKVAERATDGVVRTDVNFLVTFSEDGSTLRFASPAANLCTDAERCKKSIDGARQQQDLNALKCSDKLPADETPKEAISSSTSVQKFSKDALGNAVYLEELQGEITYKFAALEPITCEMPRTPFVRTAAPN